MPAPSLSVVVIGKNEEANLNRCFASVHAIDYPADEMERIYVDSASIDCSRDVAESWGWRVIALSDPPYTAARGRDVGWRASSAPLIMFVDGDCSLEPHFAARAMAEFRNSKVAVVWGTLRELHSEGSVYHRALALRFQGHPTGPGHLLGGNCLCRRSALEAVAGYEQSLEGAENANLGWRIRDKGFLIIHIDAPMVVHNSEMIGWRQYWRRGFRFGYGEARYVANTPITRFRLWDRGSGERLTDLLYFVAFLLGAAAGLALWQWGGLGLSAALLAALVVAKAWRARRKGALGTVLFYALHAQIFCVPMLAGHIRYCIDSLLRRSRNR